MLEDTKSGYRATIILLKDTKSGYRATIILLKDAGYTVP
jgi:hypothetical protein